MAAKRLERIRKAAEKRDRRMRQVAKVRRGEALVDGMFNERWPKSIVANLIDVAARNIAEVLAPLPTFSCNAADALNDGQRTKADKRTRLANYYVDVSRLGVNMLSGADRYITYGFLPFRVEVDREGKHPRIVLDDPMGSYFEQDRYGKVTAYARVWKKPAKEIAALFPEHYQAICHPSGGSPAFKAGAKDEELEIVRWYDDNIEMLFLPGRKNLVLAQGKQKLGRVPVRIAVRPGLDDEIRGQFDDALWIQMARSQFELYKLQAVDKMVNAPTVVPHDAQKITFGPNATIRTDGRVEKVQLQLPPSVFTEGAQLEHEVRIAGRYPESLDGNLDASVITGQGVEALQAGYQSQIAAAQDIFADTLQDILAMCFELDEKVWGNEQKTIDGKENGQPKKLVYTPSIVIAGDYTVDVSYGLLHGMDPNRALIFALQAMGGGLLSKSTTRKLLPNGVDPAVEERIISIEQMREGATQGFLGLLQALPAFVQMGTDPLPILRQAAIAIQASKTKPIEDALLEAFKPPPEAQPAPGTEAPAEGGAPGEGPQGPGGGLDQTGLMPGVAAGQQGLPPGGLTDIQTLVAGLKGNGQANLSANVQRRVAV